MGVGGRRYIRRQTTRCKRNGNTHETTERALAREEACLRPAYMWLGPQSVGCMPAWPESLLARSVFGSVFIIKRQGI